MGRPKQLLELDGRPLLQHVVDAAAGARLRETVVVLGHEADAIAEALVLPEGARAVVNPDYARGQSTSLRAGLEALDAGADAAVILLGDQPRMTPEQIARVVDAFYASGAPLVRSLYGKTPGHPVVVARSEWAALREIGGDKGARDLLKASTRSLEVDMGPPLLDVDTWEAYERLRGRA
jgi:molybdenum cofactor cytidylyltransferase